MTFFGRQTPSTSANDYNAMVFVIQQQLLKLQTNTLVKVISCTTNDAVGPVGFVTVQPLVNQMTGNRQAVPHGQIFNIPYIRLQGGSNAVIMDPKPGDIGTMVCASRDISAVKTAKGVANPGSFRAFDWADGMYIPGTLNGTPTQYLRMSSGGIILLSPTAITLQSPANKVVGPLEVTGATTLDTTLEVTGDSTLTGAVDAPSGLTTTTILAASAVFSGNVTAASFTGGGGGGGGTVTSIGYSVNATYLALGGTASPITTSGAFTLDLSVAAKANLALAATALQSAVTSVGLTVNATYIAIGGTTSPITGTGTFTLDLSVAAKASLALAATALQSISIATGTGLTGGPLAASGSTVALANTAVTPGSYTSANITVDAQGRLTAASNGSGGGTYPAGISTGLFYWFEGDLLPGAGGSAIPQLTNNTPVIGAIIPPNALGTGATVGAAGLNGLNVAVFPGNANGNYQFAQLPPGPLTQSTGFIVFKATSAAAAYDFLSGSSSSLEYATGATGHMQLVQTFVAVIATGTTLLTAGTWYQANYTYNSLSGAYSLRLSQASDGSGTNAKSITAASNNIGYNQPGSTNFFNGSLAEFILYTRILTGTEITAVENYLHTKWGV